MTTLPRGLYTALITPFNEQGEIDFEGLKANLEDQIASYVAGIVLTGSTGEGSTLTENELKELVPFAKKVTNGKTTLVVGIASPSTKKCVEQLQMAQEGGADAILAITPYSNKPSQEGIYHHFQTLANSTEVPIILYNHPGRCHVPIALDTLRRLILHPQIAGIKDCSGDLNYFMELCRTFGQQLQIFSGDDGYAYPHLALGASGLFSVASNLFPHVMNKLVQLVLERRFDEALSLHYKLLPLFHALNSETNPIPVKKGMKLLGKPSGSPRLPLTPLSASNTLTLEKLLCVVRPTSNV